MNQKLSNAGGFPPIVNRVNPHMVRSRTVELAIKAGRTCTEIRQCDYERVKRQLTGETDLDLQNALLYGCYL